MASYRARRVAGRVTMLVGAVMLVGGIVRFETVPSVEAYGGGYDGDTRRWSALFVAVAFGVIGAIIALVGLFAVSPPPPSGTTPPDGA